MPETETAVRPAKRKRAALEYIAILLGAALVLVALSLLLRQTVQQENSPADPPAIAGEAVPNGAHS
ncbi:MAG: hypothetical protein IJG45_02765 [Oscillospiraceae bacterium]|nr:hypothetical protein [Oscillospiraceae bacterium]